MPDVTLILGDCLDVLKGLPDGSIDAVVTDPPYGINYHHGNQAGGPRSTGGKPTCQVKWPSIAGDSEIDGRWLAEAFRVLKVGGAAYLCTRQDVEPEWRRLVVAAGFTFKQRLTWHKRVGGKGDLAGTYAPTTEDVIFASKGRHRLNRRPSMLLDVGCVPTWEYRHHPHQKPVALPRLLMEASTRPGDLVLDPYMGSGTTGMACMMTGRRFIGIESDPTYFVVAEARIASARMEAAVA